MFDHVDQLTQSMARGDRAAIEAFYRRYFDWMYRVAQQSTRRDEAFCLDVVHDAVLRIVRTIRKMDSQAHLENWLRVVVKTCAFDRLRSDLRRQQREESHVAATRQQSDGLELAELRDALAQLDPAIVQIIELRFNQGLTLSRLANLFQTTTGAIDGRLRRAIEQLRKNWSDDEQR